VQGLPPAPGAPLDEKSPGTDAVDDASTPTTGAEPDTPSATGPVPDAEPAATTGVLAAADPAAGLDGAAVAPAPAAAGTLPDAPAATPAVRNAPSSVPGARRRSGTSAARPTNQAPVGAGRPAGTPTPVATDLASERVAGSTTAEPVAPLTESSVEADPLPAPPTVRPARARHAVRAHRRAPSRRPVVIALTAVAAVAALAAGAVLALRPGHSPATPKPVSPAVPVATARTITGDLTLYQDNIQKVIADGGAIEQSHPTCGGTGAFAALAVGAPVTVRNGKGTTLATGRITTGTWISVTTSRTPGTDGVPGRTLDGVTLPGLPGMPPQTISAGFCDLGFTVDGVPAASSYAIEAPLGGSTVFTARQLDSAHWHATLSVIPNPGS